MEWIKIPIDEILLSSRTDWQNMCLIKYMALYCQLERQPTDIQLSRIMNKKQLKYVLSECEVVSELVQSCIEVVSKKRNRDKLNYKNKTNKNNNLTEIPLAGRYRSDATDKIRLDKTRKEKEIYKEKDLKENNNKIITKEKKLKDIWTEEEITAFGNNLNKKLDSVGLKDFDRKFCQDMFNKFTQYGDNMLITEKQLVILETVFS